MTDDYDKLAEALEYAQKWGSTHTRDLATTALPLARQLIEERDAWKNNVDTYYEENQTLVEQFDVAVKSYQKREKELREENERLKEERDYSAYGHKVADLQARLTAAENAKALAELEANRQAQDRLVAEAKLKRAEAVVEAAKEANRWLQHATLAKAIRRYEEGKSDPR